MKRRALERLFLRLLAVAPVALLDGCTGSASEACGALPDGHASVTFAAIDQAESDAGVAPDGGAYVAGEGLGYLVCQTLCPSSEPLCAIESVSGDTATLSCHADCTGRRPAGLDPARSSGLFVEMARLEAASVVAFRRLRKELAQHGAPRRLLRACSRAARDEIRHARMAGALARRRGGQLEAPRIGAASPRSIEAMAIENAVEGCVRETYGALIARRAAHAHPDAEVRAAMKRIARDEARHATLAWTIAAWLEPRLDGAARHRVRSARDEAVRELAVSTTSRVHA
jgi:rubrerythrin